MKYMGVPASCLPLPLPEQVATVQRLVRDHYQKNRGECLFFGKIVGYRFVYTYDASILLVTNGTMVQEEGGPFRPPSATLRIGHKIIGG